MTIDLGPELEAQLAAVAKRTGRTSEQVVIRILQRQILAKEPLSEPRDDFERLLREVGTPCGVSLSDETLSREAMYD